MSLYLPPQWRWLAWIAGTTWPDGDEDRMWADAQAWRTASAAVQAVVEDVYLARDATLAAYPAGDGAAQMTTLFDSLHDGDGSVQQLADFLDQIHDSCFDMGTELQDTKLTIILSLAWLALEILWAWAFPPTAAAVEAAAIASARSGVRLVEDAAMDAIKAAAARLGAFTGKGRLFWKSLARGEFVLPSAKGIASYSIKLGENAVGSFGLDAAVQLGQMADGKRRHFNWTEAGLSVLGSAAGAIPSREFARYLGAGIDSLAGGYLANALGRGARGAVIGTASGVVSAVFGNVAVGAATGDFSSLSNPASWVGGMARGGMVGGARGLSVKMSPITTGDIRYGLWGKGRGEVKYLPTDGSVTDIPGKRLPAATSDTTTSDTTTSDTTTSDTVVSNTAVSDSIVSDTAASDSVGPWSRNPTTAPRSDPEGLDAAQHAATDSRPWPGSNHSGHVPDTNSVSAGDGEYEGSDAGSVHSNDAADGGSNRTAAFSAGSAGRDSAGSMDQALGKYGGAQANTTSGSTRGGAASNDESVNSGANVSEASGPGPAFSAGSRPGGSDRDSIDSIIDMYGGSDAGSAPGPSRAASESDAGAPNSAANAHSPGGSGRNSVSGEGGPPDGVAPPPGKRYPTDPLPGEPGFLGKATDMKSKTRPKREPEWEAPPEGYRAGSAPPESFWLPGGGDASPDVPWTPPDGGRHRDKKHHHHHPPDR